MENITKLSELKVGDLIQFRNELFYMYMGQPYDHKIFVRNNGEGWMSCRYINEEMLHSHDRRFDIVKVYRTKAYYNLLNFNPGARTLIFDREEIEKAEAEAEAIKKAEAEAIEKKQQENSIRLMLDGVETPILFGEIISWRDGDGNLTTRISIKTK